MFLVIAEKPSVGQSLAKNLSAYKREDGYLEGENCIVSWCLGHLAEYVSPEMYDASYEKWQFADLPIIPKVWQMAVSEDKKEQFEVLEALLHRDDVEYVVNACDAGREGELIFQRVYELTGCKKPVRRLWISSMEDAAIQKGFENLKDSREYANLCAASVCRAKADWLIGMNATRAYTTQYYKRLVVGRVQTPTLAMLAERQDKIDHFKKETYYKVALKDGTITFNSLDIVDSKEADELVSLCMGKDAVITTMKKEQKKSSPPRLFDLTSLQRAANRLFGYTAQKTLNMLQELYEEKLVTYPRTDSQYVTDDMEGTIRELLDQIPTLLSFLDKHLVGNRVERVVNNAKVTDHHAILPTMEAFKRGITDLSKEKQNLMVLIGQQLVQATGDDYIYEQIDVTVQCAEHDFTTRGKCTVQSGYKAVDELFRKSYVKSKTGEEEKKDMEAVFPVTYQEGAVLSSVKATKSQHDTSPPKPYSEDTLLAAMETAGNKEFDADTEKKGLGTPATRANIIEKLVSSGYAARKGKQILPTPEGRELILVMPEYLKSAAMTAEWENKLLLMERGEIADTEFMEEIHGLIETLIETCSAIPEEERRRFSAFRARESIGTCPVCGSEVYEGKQNFYCANRECKFALWKENRFLESMKKEMTKKIATDLLKKGCSHVKGFYSKKKDKFFDADLVMEISEERANFRLEFPKNDKKKSSGKKKKS
jgi:DNA topoisomerase-3